MKTNKSDYLAYYVNKEDFELVDINDEEKIEELKKNGVQLYCTTEATVIDDPEYILKSMIEGAYEYEGIETEVLESSFFSKEFKNVVKSLEAFIETLPKMYSICSICKKDVFEEKER